jgi:hypothetical protein
MAIIAIGILLIGLVIAAITIVNQHDRIKHLREELNIQSEWLRDLVETLENK